MCSLLSAMFLCHFKVFSMSTFAKQTIPSFPVPNLQKIGLNICIYLQENKKRPPLSCRIDMEISHLEIPVRANFHLFLVAFALPEGSSVEVT